jgi:hypothetical protein
MAMKHWEYHLEDEDFSEKHMLLEAISERLDELDEAGWELVQIITDPDPRRDRFVTFVLRKEKEG